MYSPRDWSRVDTISLDVVVAPNTADQYIVVGGPSNPWAAPPPAWACHASHLVGVELSPTLLDPLAGLVDEDGDATTPSHAATARDPMRVEFAFGPLPATLNIPSGTIKGQGVLTAYSVADFWWDQPPIRHCLIPLPGPDWWRVLNMRVVAQGTASARYGYIHLHLGVNNGR